MQIVMTVSGLETPRVMGKSYTAAHHREAAIAPFGTALNDYLCARVIALLIGIV